MPCTPIVQSRYDAASSKSVSSEMLESPGECEGISTRQYGHAAVRRAERRDAYPHSRLSSSCLSIFLKRESLNALMMAYSARPSRIGKGSKVPMQPRNLGARPGREERVFHVTKTALEETGGDL